MIRVRLFSSPKACDRTRDRTAAVEVSPARKQLTMAKIHYSFILRDARKRAPLDEVLFPNEVLDPHGEERGNATRLEPGGPRGCAVRIRPSGKMGYAGVNPKVASKRLT